MTGKSQTIREKTKDCRLFQNAVAKRKSLSEESTNRHDSIGLRQYKRQSIPMRCDILLFIVRENFPKGICQSYLSAKTAMKSNQGGCHHEKQNRLCKSGMERTALAGCVQSDGSSKGCFVGAVRICGGTGQHDDGDLAFWCCFVSCSSAKPPASDCIWCSSR